MKAGRQSVVEQAVLNAVSSPNSPLRGPAITDCSVPARVLLFSGGLGSWAAAKRVAERHGTDNLILLFCDTLIEDPDLYRFLPEAAANVGGQLIRLKEGRTSAPQPECQIVRHKEFEDVSKKGACADGVTLSKAKSISLVNIEELPPQGQIQIVRDLPLFSTKDPKTSCIPELPLGGFQREPVEASLPEEQEVSEC